MMRVLVIGFQAIAQLFDFTKSILSQLAKQALIPISH